MTRLYHIVLYLGNAMCGKTTGMFREAVRELELGTSYTHAYSVTHSTHPKISFIKYEELKELRADNKNGMPTALLLIDQLHKFLDARQSMSARNVYMNNIIIESRQHGFSTRGTTWRRSAIDLGVRRFGEMHVLCEKSTKGFDYTYVDSDEGPLGRKTLTLEKAAKYWRYFDTTELVPDIDPKWDPRFSSEPPELKVKR